MTSKATSIKHLEKSDTYLSEIFYRAPEELWVEVCDIVQEAVIKVNQEK